MAEAQEQSSQIRTALNGFELQLEYPILMTGSRGCNNMIGLLLYYLWKGSGSSAGCSGGRRGGR